MSLDLYLFIYSIFINIYNILYINRINNSNIHMASYSGSFINKEDNYNGFNSVSITNLSANSIENILKEIVLHSANSDFIFFIAAKDLNAAVRTLCSFHHFSEIQSNSDLINIINSCISTCNNKLEEYDRSGSFQVIDLIFCYKYISSYSSSLYNFPQSTFSLPSLTIKSKHTSINNKLLFLSILTYKDTFNAHTPYYISLYDSISSVHFNFLSIQEFITFITSSNRYNGYTIISHHMSDFDFIFILNLLSDYKLSIITRGESNSIISFILRYDLINAGKNMKPNAYSIRFLDSSLLLSSTLIDLEKDILASNILNSINNIHSSKLEVSEANRTADTYSKILSDVYLSFQRTIFSKYNIDISRCATITSLSFSIFRSSFLSPTVDIKSISGSLNKQLRPSFYGGPVNVYRSSLDSHHVYDTNSLYPFVLASNDYPVGNPVYIPSISNINDFFGFCNVKVNSTPNSNYPFLVTRLNDFLISANGSFKGMYFSEEIKYALKLGYDIEIMDGYQFQRQSDIFTEFINHFYNLKNKAKADGNKSLYLASKLILNAFFGRFALIIADYKSVILRDEEIGTMSTELRNCYTLMNKLSSTHSLYKFKVVKTKSSNYSFSNVSIASAVTAYARIYMHKFISDPRLEVAYSDTDSIFCKNELDPKYIGNSLGQFKREYTIEFGRAITNKSYYARDLQGNIICKVKGFSGTLSEDQVLYLTSKDANLQLDVTHLHKDFSLHNIKEVNMKYSITNRNAKRINVFDDNNILISTRPLFLYPNFKSSEQEDELIPYIELNDNINES